MTEQRLNVSMPYVVAANPAMAAFPDVTNLAITMALSGGLIERSTEFYEAVTTNFAVVMGVLMQAGIIVSPAPAPQPLPTEVHDVFRPVAVAG